MAGDTLMLLHECGKGRPVPGILNDGVAVTPDGYFFAWADPELVNATPPQPTHKSGMEQAGGKTSVYPAPFVT